MARSKTMRRVIAEARRDGVSPSSVRRSRIVWPLRGVGGGRRDAIPPCASAPAYLHRRSPSLLKDPMLHRLISACLLALASLLPVANAANDPSWPPAMRGAVKGTVTL